MICKEPNYQDFCSKIYQYAPVCKEIVRNTQPSSFYFDTNLEPGLILQMFELGRLFLEKKMIKFSIQGRCMYPCIRPCDSLHLEPRSAREIQIGEIAVYRRFNHLFAHRTIDKGSKNGQDYIVTRPDTARFGNDGPSFDKDILGIVTGIERKGIILGTLPRKYSSVVKLFLDLCIYFNRTGEYCWNRLAYRHKYLQKFGFYRLVIGSLFINSKIEFGLQAPISSSPNSSLFRKLSLEELKVRVQEEFALSKWSLILKVNSKYAGRLSFFLKPKSCLFGGWWLCDAQLRDRYWGTNVEKKFFTQLDQILKELGIIDVSVSVCNKVYLLALFKNMGFKEVSAPKDVYLTDKHKLVVNRILMKKSIS